MHQDIGEVMAEPELIKQMAEAGIDVRVSDPAEFSALIRDDIVKWAEVVKRAGLQAQ